MVEDDLDKDGITTEAGDCNDEMKIIPRRSVGDGIDQIGWNRRRLIKMDMLLKNRGEDCNDLTDEIHPDAERYYDGVDQNCDNVDDYDADQDEYAAIDLKG